MSGRRGQRDLHLLALGQTVSTAGDSAALVALLLRMRPHGSGWVAVLLAAELVPFVVCAPVSGRVADRFETRRVLVAALVGQALIAVPLALVTSPVATVSFFVVLNAFATLVRPATSALVPAVVGPDQAALGYARLATGASLGWTVGPALGGLLTGTAGPTATLSLDAATFAVMAAATAVMRAGRPPARRAPQAGLDKTAGGLALLWRAPVLRTALLVSAVATGCAVVDNVAAPFRFIDQLGTTDLGYGLYLAIWGSGALVGVQVLPRISQRRQPTALAAGNLLTGLGIAGIGLAPTLTVALAASLIGGFGNGVVGVTENALIAAHTPAAQHGRAFAAAGAVMQTAIGAGTALAAPLITALGAGMAMASAGTLAAFAAVAGILRAHLGATIAPPRPR